jgi:hypothetical protein
MTLTISDDLRQALASQGTPLKLFDPQTGETYLVVREASMEPTAPFSAEQELALSQIPSDRLQQLAQQHRPPQEWYEREEEDLFE